MIDFEARQLLLGKIVIHWDYTTGNEISYIEGRKINGCFVTHCLEFFDTKYNSIIISKDKTCIDVKELLSNPGFYTIKEIRKKHIIKKLLLDNVFVWKKFD